MVLATIQAILYGWVLGIERGEWAAHEGAHLSIPHFVQFILKFVSPLFLVAILIGNVATDGPGYWKTLATSPAAGLSFGFILVVAAFFFALIHIAGRRWQMQGRLSDRGGDAR